MWQRPPQLPSSPRWWSPGRRPPAFARRTARLASADARSCTARPPAPEIDLTATGLPARQRCTLVAIAPGAADIAGTWEATYGGSARIAGTTAIPASRLTALRIESDTGRVLLSIRVQP